MSAFVPSNRFAGAKPGFVFKLGEQGVGYYQDTASRQQKRTRVSAMDDYLSRMAGTPRSSAQAAPPIAHYRQVAQQQQGAPPQQRHPAAYRQPMQNAKPEWAYHTTESRRAFQDRYDSSMERVSGSRQRRQPFEPLRSQIDCLSQTSQPPQRYERYDPYVALGARGSGNTHADMPAAGGRSNMAGPSNAHGVQRHATGTGVIA